VKKTLISLFVSAAMVIAPMSAMAADTGPLPPGAPAGVKQAQADTNPPILWIIGAGVVIALGILVLSINNDSNSLAPTTTSTGTPPTAPQG
jgi:hypothetical protein